MLNLHLCVRRSGVLGVEMKTLPVNVNATHATTGAMAMLLPAQNTHTLQVFIGGVKVSSLRSFQTTVRLDVRATSY